MCARTGGVLAPMMYFLRRISPHAPMVLCGLCPLLGSALTLLLPETANKPLPDTIEDVEGSNMRFDTPIFKVLFFLFVQTIIFHGKILLEQWQLENFGHFG